MLWYSNLIPVLVQAESRQDDVRMSLNYSAPAKSSQRCEQSDSRLSLRVSVKSKSSAQRGFNVAGVASTIKGLIRALGRTHLPAVNKVRELRFGRRVGKSAIALLELNNRGAAVASARVGLPPAGRVQGRASGGGGTHFAALPTREGSQVP